MAAGTGAGIAVGTVITGGIGNNRFIRVERCRDRINAKQARIAGLFFARRPM